MTPQLPSSRDSSQTVQLTLYMEDLPCAESAQIQSKHNYKSLVILAFLACEDFPMLALHDTMR